MKVTQQKLAARRLYLELCAVNAKVSIRPRHGRPGEFRALVSWTRSLPNEQGYALRERVRVNEDAMLDLVWRGSDADDWAILTEGGAA